jgi:hypothetical protein
MRAQANFEIPGSTLTRRPDMTTKNNGRKTAVIATSVSSEAIRNCGRELDCFASLAMTEHHELKNKQTDVGEKHR